MTFRAKYWSCTSFADKVRGLVKPQAATSKEWRDWKSEAAKKHPIRFWIAEEMLDTIQNILNSPKDALYAMTYWFNNRFIEKTHMCRTGLKKGQWHETPDRIMYGMFNELVWFVSEQKGWFQFISHSDIDYKIPFWKHKWPFRHFTNFNYPELGLKYLEWESTLHFNEEWLGYDRPMTDEEKAEMPYYGELTPQAKSAIEVMELYKWWTEVRPNRPDPYDESGWSTYCDTMREKYGEDSFFEDRTEEESETSKIAHDKLRQIDEAYEKEDTEMMCRLITIRHSLWT